MTYHTLFLHLTLWKSYLCSHRWMFTISTWNEWQNN